jgi:hypothetical protein
MAMGGHRKEDEFWVETLTALVRYLGAPPATVHTRTVCVDPRRQWGNVTDVWQNSMMRSLLRTITAPVARFARHRQHED